MLDKIFKISVIVIALLFTTITVKKVLEPNDLIAQNRDISQLENQIRNLESKISRLESEVSKASRPTDISISGLPGRINELSRDVSSLKSEIRSVDSKVNRCESDIRSLQSKVR